MAQPARRAVRVPLAVGALVAAALALPAVALGGTMAPTITGVSPSSVSSLGGTTLTITGTGFAAYMNLSISIGGQPVSTWSLTDFAHISAVAPAHAPGAVEVRFTSPISNSWMPSGPVVATGLLSYYLAAPSTPSAPAAVAGDGLAVVTVAASPGGEAATSHLITASPGGATCTVSAATGSCTVSGLTNGTAYRFTDTAINDGGSSSPSAASAAVTPVAGAATPAAPAAPTPSEPVVVPVADVPPLPKASVARGTGGSLVTTGVVPDGATSVVQSAQSGGAASTEVLRRRALARTHVSTRCPISTTGGTRTYRCTVTLPRGRWTLVTQAKAGSTVVAQSVRVVTVRRSATPAVVG